ncbi:MAG: ABC transporter substrate-binding protein [Thermodesulfovibrionales bacterium]
MGLVLKKRSVLYFFLLYLCGIDIISFASFVEASQYKRIVSLSPSTTEILFSLGLSQEIVGVTNFCDYPEEARKKDKVGGMSNPSIEAIISLRPDIVVMTMDGNPKEVEERLRSMKIKTYVFRAKRLDELPQAIRDMGMAMGVKERAERLASELEETFSRLKKDHAGKTHKKKILFILWPEPLIVAGPGTAIDDAIKLLGAENIAARSRIPYPKYSIEEVMRQSPDVILVGHSMGKDIREASKGLFERLKSIPAVKKGKVFYVGDGLYRLGPRVIKGIEEVAACLR